MQRSHLTAGRILPHMSAMVAPRWIVSPRFDLLCFFGGAALSLLFLGLYFVARRVDRGALVGLAAGLRRAAHRRGVHPHLSRCARVASPAGLLLVSLFTFAVGPLLLLATELTGSAEPFLLFLGFATFYGYYHVVRQH